MRSPLLLATCAALLMIGSAVAQPYTDANDPIVNMSLEEAASSGSYGFSLRRNEIVAGRLARLQGLDMERLQRVLSVSPQITDDGRYILGYGCQDHACDVTVAAIVVDMERDRVFAAITDRDGHASWPSPTLDWPEDVHMLILTNLGERTDMLMRP